MNIAGFDGEPGSIMDGGPGDDVIGSTHGPDTDTGAVSGPLGGAPHARPGSGRIVKWVDLRPSSASCA
jgi:hypothetical protein